MLRSRNNFYDPQTHITAGQLRRLGFLMSELLPDAAFVRRVAVGLRDCEDLADGTATLGLDVLEPFEYTDSDVLAVAC